SDGAPTAVPKRGRAEATGGGPIPFATGGTRHPANHAADEHGSIPVTSLRCFRKFIKVRARRRDERAANEWEHAGSAEAADGFHGPQRDVDRVGAAAAGAAGSPCRP